MSTAFELYIVFDCADPDRVARFLADPDVNPSRILREIGAFASAPPALADRPRQPAGSAGGSNWCSLAARSAR
jgi:hypothetical protein